MITDNQFGGVPTTKPGHLATGAATREDAGILKERAPILWIPVAQELPPEGVIVRTKLKDKYGTRFVRLLTRCAGDWYNTNEDITDYPPTHWARD